MTPLIVTDRLELLPFRREDAAELHEIFSDPDTHTIGDGPYASVAQTEGWITRRIQAQHQHGLLWYAVRDRATGRLLGNCGLFIGRTGEREPEIGYEIRRSYQGQGLAGEAARAVLDDALAGGVSRVWATIRPHNIASLHVAAKIGLVVQYTMEDGRGPLVYLARPPCTADTKAGR